MAASAIALTASSAGMASAADLDALYAAAKKEGQLTTIALPHDWC
ncbi:ABC transporter substrate-binding protein, partial [Thioclava sp. BHET1]